MSHHICLEWSNHKTLLSELKNFLMMETMIDVTLACDGKTLKAHKLILSACSPFFQAMFKDNPCKHPIVILPNVKFEHLVAVINFIYQGEVYVSEDELEGVFKTANILKIKVLGEVMELNNHSNDESANQSISESEKPCSDETENIPMMCDASECQLQSVTCMLSPRKESESQSVCSSSEHETQELQSKLVDFATEELYNDMSCQSCDSDSMAVPEKSHCIEASQNILEEKSVEENEVNLEDPTLSTIEQTVTNDQLAEEGTDESMDSENSEEVPLDQISKTVQPAKAKTYKSNAAEKDLENSEEIFPDQISKNDQQEKDKTYKSITPQKDLGNSKEIPRDQISKNDLPGPSLLKSDKKQQQNSSKAVDITSILSLSRPFVLLTDVMSLIPEDQQFKLLQDLPQKKSESEMKLSKISKKPMPRCFKLQKCQAKDSSESTSRKVLNKIDNTGSANGLMRLFKCDSCPYETKYNLSLKRHFLTKHNKVKNYKCDQCSYAATLKQYLVRHKASVHDYTAPKYFCKMCSYKSTNKGNLKRHVEIIHERKKPYKCDQCSFHSAHKVCLNKHKIGIHEQRRDFLCEFCTYRCSAIDNLRRHVFIRHHVKLSVTRSEE